MNQKFNTFKAFTLIELLVVIGIIGILSAIGVVSFGAVREKARRGACIATLRSNFNSDENLVAYWNFDDSANRGKDFWGNNGILNGGVTAVINGGIIDDALNFNGATSYIRVLNNASLNPISQVTLLAWIKPSNTLPNAWYFIAGKSIYWANTDYGLQINNKKAGFFIDTTQASYNEILLQDKWYLLAGTYNGTQIMTYVNGNPSGAVDHPNSNLNNNKDFTIGADNEGTYIFPGMIDEVILYNRALSADEIASHYKACKK